MRVVHKAVCCVVQNDSLLCFEHPSAGVQIPKGTVEFGETPRSACLRELREESGIHLTGEPLALGEFERLVPGGPGECGAIERHVWHVFAVRASGLPERWTHIAEGSAAESGLLFRFFWHPLSAGTDDFQPAYVSAIELVRSSRHAV